MAGETCKTSLAPTPCRKPAGQTYQQQSPQTELARRTKIFHRSSYYGFPARIIHDSHTGVCSLLLTTFGFGIACNISATRSRARLPDVSLCTTREENAS